MAYTSRVGWDGAEDRLTARDPWCAACGKAIAATMPVDARLWSWLKAHKPYCGGEFLAEPGAWDWEFNRRSIGVTT